LSKELLNKIKNDNTVVIVLETENLHGMAEQRRAFFDLIENKIENPVILKRNYSNIIFEDLQLYSSTDFGALLIDGFGDGVWLSVSDLKSEEEKSGTYIKSFIKKI